MKREEFLAHVSERADIESSGEARIATEATLRVLGSRLGEPEAEDLAAQLPETFGADLTWESATEPESFGVETFVRRVREHESDDPRIEDVDAETHAIAVASVLTDAVSGGELGDVRAQLPAEYDRLFDPRSVES
jgi:uncharacterized protein (DUF2267 family)